MLHTVDLQQVMVIDIETVAQYRRYADLDARFQALWDAKIARNLDDDESPADRYADAGLHAEFGKVICISAGVFHLRAGAQHFRVKSFHGHNERTVLVDFAQLLQAQSSNLILCGHNLKGFDLPFLCRRMLANGLRIPTQLDVTGKKPWEINHLDTMELWRFGDFRHYSSLNLLAAVFDIPTPKDDISGEDVYRVYYEENNLERVRVYCEKDVITAAQLLLKMRNEAVIAEEHITFA